MLTKINKHLINRTIKTDTASCLAFCRIFVFATSLVIATAAPTASNATVLPSSDMQLKYRVYAFGLPTWFDASVDVSFADQKITMISTLKSWLVGNFHETSFLWTDCQYQPSGYTNSGFSPGWEFDDALQYDWENGVARYQGYLQRPQQERAYQEFEHVLDQAQHRGFYVDKLSQFFVMGCYFDRSDPAESDEPLRLNYLDDTLGRYRVQIRERGEKIKVAGKPYSTIEVQSEPYEATPGSIHRRVNYWLAPDLGYLPVLIKTKIGSMPLKVRLTNLGEAASRETSSR